MFLIDSHCHLDALNYSDLHIDLNDVLAKAEVRGVKHCLAVGTTVDRTLDLIKICASYSTISIAGGIHPLHVDELPNITTLEQLARRSEIVALGETGLDYYYSEHNHSLQQDYFRQHIRIANQVNKPIIVHTRNARKDTLHILAEENAEKCGGVLHCFSEDKQTAFALLDMGFYISFSGIITFKNAQSLREVANYIPLDRLLIETDSPYLAPVPFRGKENQPAYVREVADYLAVLKGVTTDQLADITTQNFIQLFKCPINKCQNKEYK